MGVARQSFRRPRAGARCSITPVNVYGRGGEVRTSTRTADFIPWCRQRQDASHSSTSPAVHTRTLLLTTGHHGGRRVSTRLSPCPVKRRRSSFLDSTSFPIRGWSLSRGITELVQLNTRHTTGQLGTNGRNLSRPLMRHLLAFWNGEDIDVETGSPHIVASAWHCLTMVEFAVTHPEFDDRPVRGTQDTFLSLSSRSAALT